MTNKMAIYAATPWQKRFWLEWEIAPTSSAYTLFSNYAINGDFHFDRFKKAFQELALAQACFRTKFFKEENMLYQQVGETPNISYEEVDLSGLPENKKESFKIKAIQEFNTKPFDLENEELCRVHCLRLSEKSFVLSIAVHHIITDGYSFQRMIEGLSHQYHQNVNTPITKEISIPNIETPETLITEGLHYWEDQLSDKPLHFDFSYPSKERGNQRGITLYHFLSEEETHEILLFSKQQKSTLFCLIASTFAATLSRVFQKDSFVLTYPVNARDKEKQKDVLGCFVNNQLMPIQLTEQESLSDLLTQVTNTRNDSKKYQNISLTNIAEHLRKTTKTEMQNIFNIAVDQTSFLTFPLRLKGVDVEAILPHDLDAAQDLSLGYEMLNGKIGFRLLFRAGLFEKFFMQQLLRSFLLVLKNTLKNPDQMIYSAKLLDHEMYKNIITTFNHTQKKYQPFRGLHQQFEAVAESTPVRIAVEASHQALDYKTLNEKSNQFARYLLSQEVSSNQIIGIALNQGIDFYIAILGTLKAGAAYLPLDKSYPKERLKFMLEDASSPLIITEKEFSQHFDFYPKQKILIDEIDCSNLNHQNLNILINNNQLAYVMYTSGSTGKPKGVMVSHQNIAERMQALLDIYEVKQDWIHLQYSSYSFDASLEELFLATLSGGKVVFAPRHINIDPEILTHWIEKYSIHAINFVPSVFQIFLDYLENTQNIDKLSTLKTVICGGEALSSQLVKRFYQLSHAKLFNTYGPTENTIDSTYYLCSPNKNYELIPIGKPLPNSSTYILDKHLQALPPGAIGELYVGGVGVAQGYLNQAALTQEKFIDSPFNASEKLYRTGDLVRFNEEKEIEFIGRIDHQIKIRGLRIELGEIREILLQHPQVKEAIIQIKKDAATGENIIAYLLIHDAVNKANLIDTLKTHTLKSLPTYMLPTGFVILDSIPLTLNGKLDIAKLPEFHFEKQIIQKALQTATEKFILEACAEVLNNTQLSLEDNFFHSGGHSLIAIQFISKINKQFDIRLPVKTLFDYPQLAQLAAYLDNDIQKKPIPVGPGQRALWLLDKMLPNNAGYDIPEFYEIKGLSIDHSLFERALEWVLKKHTILHTRFEEKAGEVYQVIQPNHSRALSFLDFSTIETEAAIAQAQKLAIQINAIPYDLTQGPLYRFHLIKISEKHFFFLANFHHIIFDGMSSEIFIKDLSSAYQQKLKNLPFQYADYANHMQTWLKGSDAETQLTYWKNILRHPPEMLALPYDYQRPKLLGLEGRSLYFTLAQTPSLYQFARHHQCSLYVVMLSTFFLLLHRYTLQEEITLGTVVSNRNSPELEQLIGYFVNTVPLKIDVHKNDTFQTLLSRVQEHFLNLLSNKDIPFEKILELSNIERDMSAHPLFQVMFAFEQLDKNVLMLGDTVIKALPTPQSSAKYDLALYIQESADEITGRFEFNTALFKESTIQVMMSHYQTLLRNILQSPENLLTLLPLEEVSHAHPQHQLNQTDKSFPQKNALLHKLFENQVEKNPSQTAIITPSQKISYEMLNTAANHLAMHLIKQGLKKQEIVGIVMEKGWEQVVATLAILKAGAIYLPISSTEPTERMNNILHKAHAEYLLVQKNFETHLLENKKITVIDESLLTLKDPESFNTHITLTPEALAYIIFTSGSTGEPKGVMISHEGAVNTILDINDRFNVSSQDKILGISQLNFDLSVYDIFGTLAAGATLVLPKAEDIKEPKTWLALMEKYQVSIWNSVPALMQMLTDSVGSPKTISSALRLVLMSGDWIPLHLPQKIQVAFGKEIEIISLGGATEASIWSILYPIKHLDPHWSSIPYGYPMANQHIYVLDEHLQLAPTGTPGEIFIGGIGVAKGYYGDTKKTQASFITHPSTGEYLYKTGDMGRYCQQGYIEFLGRKDTQIKLNGFRIELNEIQHQLVNLPEVLDAAVLMDDKQSLIAYVVPSKKLPLHEESIMRYLQTKLPSYMVPVTIVQIESIPLSHNGKVDKKALPKVSVSTQIQAPETQAEKSLATLWHDILGIDLARIGMQSHFFHLGGNSLTAVKLIMEIQKTFACEISVKSLFESPRLTDMAHEIELRTWTQFPVKNQEQFLETGTI